MTSMSSKNPANAFTPIFFNACFDKTQVKNLVSWYLATYGEYKTIKFLENLKLNGFHQATVAGISLGIEDLQIPPEKPTLITQTQLENEQIDQFNTRGLLTSVEKSTYLIDIWNQTSDKLRQTAIQNFKLKNPVNPVYMMAFSGARGNVSQVRQLIAMRGLMADPQGAILEFPIQSNFREGLTITEYLISCYGARKGLVDTALRTATSGYLTRRLVDSAQHAVVSILDCQTEDYRILEGSNLKSRLVGRVLAKNIETSEKLFFRNDVITSKDALFISNQYNQVAIRSPLTCTARTSVCQKCYGWSLSSGTLVQIGEAVGVIAAQSIGEPGTQLTMRTFHTGGVGVFSDQALKPLFAPYSAKIHFVCALPGHFIRTPNGKIAFMIKYLETDQNKPLVEFISTFEKIVLTEKDLPPGSILFVKQGEFVPAKTLIAQASYIKVTKQQLPESSHPVYASQNGQVFYESMSLIIEQQKIASSEFQIPKHFQSIQSKKSKHLGLSETRSMAQIGSFWVLKNSPQQDIQIKTSLVQSGDLVSTKTSLGSYSFFSPYNQYLQLIKNSLTFGLYTCQLELTSIFKQKNCLVYKPQSPELGLFIDYLTSNSIKTLIWYPNYFHKNKKLNYLTYINSLYTQKVFDVNDTTRNLVSQGTVYQIDLPQFNTFHSKNNKIIKSPLRNLRYKTGFTINSQLKLKVQSSNNTLLNSNIKHSNLNKNSWPVLFNSNEIKSLVYRLIPNDKEISNISIPKFHWYVTEMKLFERNKQHFSDSWYKPNQLLNTTKFSTFYTQVNKDELISFYPTQGTYNSRNWYKANSDFALKEVRKQSINSLKLVCIHKCAEFSIPELKSFNKSIYKFLFPSEKISLSKQTQTGLKKGFYPVIKTNLQTKSHTGWYKSSDLFTIQFQFGSKLASSYTKLHANFTNLPNSHMRGLRIYSYYESLLQQVKNLNFKTFKNNFVLQNSLFSLGNIYSNNTGEFLFSSNQDSTNSICLLQSADLIKIPNLNSTEHIKIGQLIRWGEEIEPGYGAVNSGQLVKKTKTALYLRLGIPILASARGIIHVKHNDLIRKNQLIVTLKSRRLQTEDIVQGIPKIEQLFEARESQSGEILSDTVHLRLRSAFVRELELLTTEHWSTAVDKSFLEAQNFLVENIETAYSNQGVKISEKHIEVIVRQMTSRVRILEPGETGLLPGELVHHTWVKKFNQRISQIGLREATYEPIVLGISKSVLQSDSFLLAASFQEVSRVLIKSSLSKKRDFLQGLHENVIVGQSIPAGTGLISTKLSY